MMSALKTKGKKFGDGNDFRKGGKILANTERKDEKN